jgi:hypothetical protein
MPFGDGTGPMGLGPMTGRGAGFCAGSARLGFTNAAAGYPYRYGYLGATPLSPRWGWGLGRRFGRGRGFGRSWRRWGPYGYPW